MAGEKDQVLGKGKELLGKATGDDKMESEGKGQNLGGKIADAAQTVKDTATGAYEAAVEAGSNLMGNNKDSTK